jgi:hypothetical protein
MGFSQDGKVPETVLGYGAAGEMGIMLAWTRKDGYRRRWGTGSRIAFR